mgnify:FL=1
MAKPMLQATLANGTSIASQLRPAHTHWTRMKGLLGTKTLPEGHGLWIRPCNQVHMYFMRYAIDLIFIDTDHRVVEVIEEQPVSSISPKVKAAHSVLELPTGTIARTGVKVGDALTIAPAGGAPA